MCTAKIVSRKFARQGGTCMFTQEQIQTAQLIGVKIPAPLDVVTIEDSVNPATGAINEQWVNISL